MDCKIINLPYYLLKEILLNISAEELDLICFSLTCKKFYYEREKYLIFDQIGYNFRESESIEKLPFPSYHSCFLKGVEYRQSNRLCDMVILKENEYKTVEANLEYHSFAESINGFDYNNNSSLKQIYSLHFDSPDFTDFPDLSQYDNITSVNVLSSVQTESFLNLTAKHLPPKLNDLTLNLHNIRLNICDYIPEGITMLYLSGVKDLIKPGVLPQSLRRLYINHYNHPFEQGTLPSNLKHLSFRNYGQPLQHFPVSLTSISFNDTQQEGQIMTGEIVSALLKPLVNLKSLTEFSYEDLQYIPNNLRIESIFFTKKDLQGQPLDLSLLTLSTLTDLNIMRLSNYQLTASSIPPTVTKLVMNTYLQPITKDILPPNLITLSWYNIQLHHHEPNLFPKTLANIRFGYGSKIQVTSEQLMEMLSNVQGDLSLTFSDDLFQTISVKDLPMNVVCITVNHLNLFRRIDHDTFIFYNLNDKGGFIKTDKIDANLFMKVFNF